MNSQPTHIASSQAFAALLTQCASENKLLLADFYADWCGPCRAFSPHFEQLSQQYHSKGFVFVKVNADTCKELCQEEFVTGLPTFKLYRNKECLATVVGANLAKLRSVLDKYRIQPCVLEIRAFTNEKLKLDACKALIKILESLLSKSQTDIHSINTELDEFKQLIALVPGCLNCLLTVGFKQLENRLELPVRSIDREHVRELLTQLNSISEHPSGPLTHSPSQPESQESLYARLTSYRPIVALCLDPEAQAMARSLIPTDELIREAAEKSGCAPSDVDPRAFLHQLIRWFKADFFRWAGEFTCEACGTKMINCGSPAPTKTESEGLAGSVELYACSVDPLHPRRRFARFNDPKTLLQTRLGRCGEWAICLTLCLAAVRRPFTTGYKPWFPGCRLVVDWTDHVWCEVWLEDKLRPGKQRWVHCDPGGEVDQPLLYECGWGKKLTYVFAYTVPPPSIEWDLPGAYRAVDVQEVTWRYTKDFVQIGTRRTSISEARLTDYLLRFHEEATQMWQEVRIATDSMLGVNQHPFTLASIAIELASFLTPPRAPTERLPGRKTGPLEWRRARGELGADDPDLEQQDDVQEEKPVWRGHSLILEPTEEEFRQGMFYLRYNSALDIYQRPFGQPKLVTSNVQDHVVCSKSDPQTLIKDAEKAGLKGWRTLVTRWRNIARKVEQDWHMVYLAREDDSPADRDGVIEWHLRVDRPEYEIGKVSLFANMVCHSEDAAAHLVLCNSATAEVGGDGVCVRLTPGSNPLFDLMDFKGARQLCLQGRLWTKGNEGVITNNSSAWQQAQFFRQKDNDCGIWSLEWKVEIIRKSGVKK
ncbi:hypothetical protein P879_01007 [Paragonimus westermani]|uniref:Peptide-N(4)-(N-acetyl-beta-glucosaminyl)asparagine amidase n=1 Tax=Paragonimus westermani TaxID=34504 RepID=A0A8T0DZ69_9TREM|nr:hypothetical protein P879_01007 [Paragonimus westermani]